MGGQAANLLKPRAADRGFPVDRPQSPLFVNLHFPFSAQALTMPLPYALLPPLRQNLLRCFSSHGLCLPLTVGSMVREDVWKKGRQTRAQGWNIWGRDQLVHTTRSPRSWKKFDEQTRVSGEWDRSLKEHKNRRLWCGTWHVFWSECVFIRDCLHGRSGDCSKLDGTKVKSQCTAVYDKG